MDRIAIVIPAYKSTYMREMLESLLLQDLSDCTIFVGDDCSPNNLYGIVQDYIEKMPIVYHRFEENMGGNDLVGHWMRCVSLAKDMDWVWLYSDDDIMCPNCVAEVKKAITNKGSQFDVIHINGLVVDNNLNEIEKTPMFPEYLDCSEYIKRLIDNTDNSWGINYIIRADKFHEDNGFVNFDLAWNSDRASWLQFAYPKGIYTVPEARVLWRYSGENITSLKKNKPMIIRKGKARKQFIVWLLSFMKENDIRFTPSVVSKIKYGLRCLKTDLSGSFRLALSNVGIYIKLLFA